MQNSKEERLYSKMVYRTASRRASKRGCTASWGCSTVRSRDCNRSIKSRIAGLTLFRQTLRINDIITNISANLEPTTRFF
jgi:hypothetical protein